MEHAIVIISNKDYFERALSIINEIISIGQYHDTIVFVYGDDITQLDLDMLPNKNIITKHFPDINLDQIIEKINKLDSPRKHKLFQFHKFYLFHQYFKQWNKVFYIDASMKIFNTLDPFLKLDCQNKLLVNQDKCQVGTKWLLHRQFDDKTFPNIYQKLSSNFNLDIIYFQTGIMLYDTSIIENNTFDDLLKLLYEYPIIKFNEQSIMNLYFRLDNEYNSRKWFQIPLKYNNQFLYDIVPTGGNRKRSYTILSHYAIGWPY